jgi:hypothetical protein
MRIILWHVNPLLDNDTDKSKYKQTLLCNGSANKHDSTANREHSNNGIIVLYAVRAKMLQPVHLSSLALSIFLTDRGLVYRAEGRVCNTHTWQNRKLLISDNPILSSERMLTKGYNRKGSEEEKIINKYLWSSASRNLEPRPTDWLYPTSNNVALTFDLM